MAHQLRESLLHSHPDSHASKNRWRHQESSSFALHADPTRTNRKADKRNGIADTVDIDCPHGEGTKNGLAGANKPIVANRYVDGGPNLSDIAETVGNSASLDGPAEEIPTRVDIRDVRCGPLLNYRGMRGSTWYGSVLIVTRGGVSKEYFEPELNLRMVSRQVLDIHGANGADNMENGRQVNGGFSEGSRH
jgi:hypothetical protein